MYELREGSSIKYGLAKYEFVLEKSFNFIESYLYEPCECIHQLRDIIQVFLFCIQREIIQTKHFCSSCVHLSPLEFN